jgi:hypothetical protein
MITLLPSQGDFCATAIILIQYIPTTVTCSAVTAMFFRIIPVIESQFFSGLNISKSENPDTALGEFCYTIRITGMVDVAGGVAKHLAVNIILSIRTSGSNWPILSGR